MSHLPPHAIDEFRALWKKHYGIELSREEAVLRAHQLFMLVHQLVHQRSFLATRPRHELKLQASNLSTEAQNQEDNRQEIPDL